MSVSVDIYSLDTLDKDLSHVTLFAPVWLELVDKNSFSVLKLDRYCHLQTLFEYLWDLESATYTKPLIYQTWLSQFISTGYEPGLASSAQSDKRFKKGVAYYSNAIRTADRTIVKSIVCIFRYE